MKIVSPIPLSIATLTGTFVICAAFLGSQSARADMASTRLDVYRAQPDNPAAKTQFEATQALLAEPRDSRLMELESVRLQRIGTPQALREAALLTQQALVETPARPTLRMHDAFVLARLNADGALFSQKILDWHSSAPHDGLTQPWRLALALTRWDVLTPEVRAVVLDDAEDVCVRSGLKRTRELAQFGQPAARLAVGLRLGRMERACAQFPGDAPPILR